MFIIEPRIQVCPDPTRVQRFSPGRTRGMTSSGLLIRKQNPLQAPKHLGSFLSCGRDYRKIKRCKKTIPQKRIHIRGTNLRAHAEPPF